MKDLRRWLERAPKAELHVHLRGAMPPALFRELLRQYGTADLRDRAPARLYAAWLGRANFEPILVARRTDEEAVRELFAYEDFPNFLLTYAFTGYFVREIDDFRELVRAVLRSLARQRIVYAEVTVSLREYLDQGLALDDLLAVLATEQWPGLRVQWLVDLVRNFGPSAGRDLLQALIDRGPGPIIGLTIGGSEHEYPPDLFREVYRLAAEHGFRRSVHAGEALGPESVRDALDLLGAERIGHGIRAIEDPALVERLARERIPLEVCPTSNVYTGVVSFYHDHPVARLIAAGVPVNLNTDDPGFFRTTLVEEYLHISDLGIDDAGIVDLVRNGFRHAWLDEADRAGYLADIERSLR